MSARSKSPDSCLLTACIGVGADISAALPTEILMPFAVIESCSA
jgi:hypothetical protein